MKKIMFNNLYGLTQAVLDGRKWKTRRICKEQHWSFSDLVNANENDSFLFEQPKYKVGEVVAVAQSYKDAGVHSIPEEDDEFGCYDFPAEQTNGWTNKMFVRADLMPHQIRITNVRVERLQDISDEDCLAEGIEKVAECEDLYRVAVHHKSGKYSYLSGNSPHETYAALIDRISGKGTWESNPYVFAYTFELVK